jgi:hypothetical protein
MDFEQFRLRYRQLLVECDRLQASFEEADHMYEEAHTRREEALARFRGHQEKIVGFLNEQLGGISGKRLGVRLALEADPSGGSVSTFGVVARRRDV